MKHLKLILAALALSVASLHAAAKLNLDDKGLALQGYDPVAYINPGKAVLGDPKLSATAGVATYYFSSDANLKAFKKNPAAYTPAYGGWCAYAMANGDYVDVDPKTFKVLSGTAHLFYNGFLGNTLKKWNKDEAKLKASADIQWKKLQAAPESH